MSYIRNQDKYGIQFKDVVKQYIVVENQNLKQFAEKIGIKDTSKIPNSIDISEITEMVDYEKIPTILNKYLNTVIASIGEENFSKIEKGNISLGDSTVKADGYQIKLSVKDIQEILKKVLEIAKNDEEILNMFNVGNLDQEDYKEKIEELLKDLSVEIPSESDFDIITISVYKQGKDTVKLAVNIEIEDIINMEISIGNTAKGTMISLIKTQIDNEQEKFIITISKVANTEEHEEIEMIVIQEDEDGKEELLKVNSSRNGAFSSNNIEFDFIMSSDLDIPFSTSSEKIRAEIKFKDSINFGDVPSDKNLAEENCVVINEMELKRIKTVFNKVTTLLGEKLKDEMFVSMFTSTRTLFNSVEKMQQTTEDALEKEKSLDNGTIKASGTIKVNGVQYNIDEYFNSMQ